jgi:hypothetical protein
VDYYCSLRDKKYYYARLKTPGPYTRLTGAFGEMDELAMEITADVPTRMALLCADACNSSVQQVFMHIALDVDNRDAPNAPNVESLTGITPLAAVCWLCF